MKSGGSGLVCLPFAEGQRSSESTGGSVQFRDRLRSAKSYQDGEFAPTAGQDRVRERDGFTLVEILISVFILTFGLLAAAQIIFVSVTSTTLSRSKGLAALTAQRQLEYLGDLFSRSPEAAELTFGSHGPGTVEVENPGDGSVLNRFKMDWVVSPVPGPRPGRPLNASHVAVTVTPVNAAGAPQHRALQNKVVSVSAIFSARLP